MIGEQRSENGTMKNKNCLKSFAGKVSRWAHNIGHESGPVATRMNTPQPQQNRITDLIAPDTKQETGSILAYMIVNAIGTEFEGADKLVLLSENAPQCVSKIYSELQRLPAEQSQGIRKLTDRVSLDPRSYQHHISKVYKDFMLHSPNYEPGKPSFGMLMCMISYLVELCRRFFENDRAYEIPSIHAHGTRLMLDPETPLSPSNWEDYISEMSSKQRPSIERRPSMASEAFATVLYLVDTYNRLTK